MRFTLSRVRYVVDVDQLGVNDQRKCYNVTRWQWVGSSAAAALIAGAQHAAPAAHAFAATRPRAEETATEIGAAAAVAPAMPGNGAASGGQVELTKPADWDSMSKVAKKHWKKNRAKHK